MGIVSQAMGCVFIGRGVSQAERDGLVEQIAERQRQIEEEGIYPHFVIFPEGGTSNGTCILPFKRGAFASGKAVRPVVMKLGYQLISPCYDIVPMAPLFILTLCQLYCFFDIMELPVFVPNDYLYRTHIDKVTISSTNTEAPLVSLHSPGRENANSEGPSFHAKSGEFKAVSQHDEISPADIEMALPEAII